MARASHGYCRLDNEAREELLLAVCLLPLACADLRRPVEATPYATDASLTGGAVCAGVCLTPLGRAASLIESGRLRDEPLEGWVLISAGGDRGTAQFGLTWLGVSVLRQMHWGGSKMERSRLVTCWPTLEASAQAPVCAHKFFDDLILTSPDVEGIMLIWDLEWVKEGGLVRWKWLITFLETLHGDSRLGCTLDCGWSRVPVEPAAWWTFSDGLNRCPQLLSSNSQDLANCFGPGVLVWPSWSLGPSSELDLSCLPSLKLWESANLYPQDFALMLPAGFQTCCKLTGRSDTLNLGPCSAWFGRLFSDGLISTGRLQDGANLGELIDWWWQNHAASAFSLMAPKRVKEFAGPWGGLVNAAWSEWDAANAMAEKYDASLLGANLIHSLLRRSDSRGSDVRLDTGTLFRCQAWPRACISPDRWRWSPLFAFPFSKPQPINELELIALLNLVRWKSRCASKFGQRFLVLNDNQVVIAVTAKGRSSSHRLARLLLKYNALVLATWSAPCLGYVRSAVNPADGGSRQFVK